MRDSTSLILLHVQIFAAVAAAEIVLLGGYHLIQALAARWTQRRIAPRHVAIRSFQMNGEWMASKRAGVLSALMGLVLGLADARADDWTKFQCGPTADSDVAAAPLEWSSGKNLLWQIPLTGYGQSSPVTWKSQIYITSIAGPKKETCYVTAYNLSGEKVWQHEWNAASQAENSNYVSKAAPTPAVDDAGVYCFFEAGDLLSLTHEGQVRWQRNLVQEFGEVTSRHGLAASLEQTSDRIFVWVERESEPYVLAVAKETGKDLWKVPGVGATSWSSPRLLPMDGGPHLLLSAVGSVTGLDPETGKELWKLTGVAGNSTPTPALAGPGRFLVGATQGRGDGNSGKSAASNGLVAVRKLDDGSFAADYVWRSKRSTCSFGSPIAAGGRAYFVNATGVLFCHDLETGDELFSNRIADSMWATPIALGKRVYFFGKGGAVTVIAAGTTFESLAENQTWEAAPAPPGEKGEKSAAGPFGGPVLYAAVYAHDRFLLRRGDVLYCAAAPK